MTKRWILVGIVFGSLALIALALSGKTQPTRIVPFGLNNNAVSENAASPQVAASLLSELGAQIDRVQFEWRRAEPRHGLKLWSVYDAIYRADRARGLRPLFIFGFAPQWAAESTCDAAVNLCPPARRHIADAAHMAAMIARRYPRLAGIEIWNEPNTPYFWYPRADVASYTRLLIAAYRAVKLSAPTMPVAGGSLSDSPFDTHGYISLTPFLRGIYEHGGGNYMDAIALHPYPDPGNVTATTAANPVRQALEIRDAFGHANTPLWLTETGLSRSDKTAVSEQAQAAGLTNLYRVLSSFSQVKMIIFHTLFPPPKSVGREPGFAIVQGDGQPTAAFCALRKLLQHRSARPLRAPAALC